MSAYVDGFVIPLQKKRVAAYRRIARAAAQVWLDHGAREIRECVLEDADVHCGVAFPALAGVKPGETVVFSWIVYASRAQRDRVNAAVMKDPRIAGMDPKSMPFSADRMTYGGFDVLVDAGRPATRRGRAAKSSPLRRRAAGKPRKRRSAPGKPVQRRRAAGKPVKRRRAAK